MALTAGYNLFRSRRSRKGAWIEIFMQAMAELETLVAPVRERGLKFPYFFRDHVANIVAPVRERGLKLHCRFEVKHNSGSLP